MNAAHETDMTWPRRIAVIGAAGTVGSSVAAQFALHGIGDQLTLIDVREGAVRSHVIDLSDAQTLVGVDSPHIAAGADSDEVFDLVVVAASRPESPDGDRRAFLTGNVALLERLVPQIEALAGERGRVLLLSNPVDVLAGWLAAHSTIASSRILGYALNDSARFRSAVARVLGVDSARVGGVVFGEHGDGQVPIVSSLTLDDATVELSAAQLDQVDEDIQGWFRRWSALNAGRSSGWATGVGVRVLIERLALGHPVVGTVATATLKDMPDSFIALHVRLSDDGFIPLAPLVTVNEMHLLSAAAANIGAAVDALGTSTVEGRSS